MGWTMTALTCLVVFRTWTSETSEPVLHVSLNPTSATLRDSTIQLAPIPAADKPSEAFRLQSALVKYSPEGIWEALLHQGSILLKDHAKTQQSSSSPLGIVMEVGMFHGNQCKQAAEAGFQAYCLEPSPTNHRRVMGDVARFPPEVVARMHVYNQAAGASSEGTLSFSSGGSTGDHVGDGDMWAMEKKKPQDPPLGSKTNVVQVQQVKLDDMIDKLGQDVFLIKVDTQGFEPSVFAGLQKSIHEHKLKYVLFEYWPKGMDFLADQMGQCLAVNRILMPFLQAGYKLYALPVSAHPKAPKGWQKGISSRPYDNLQENCQWYYQMEKSYPSTSYKMGYWSDFLAVAPEAPIPVSDLPTMVEAIWRRQPGK